MIVGETSIEIDPFAWVVRDVSVWIWIVDVLILAEMNALFLPERFEVQR